MSIDELEKHVTVLSEWHKQGLPKTSEEIDAFLALPESAPIVEAFWYIYLEQPWMFGDMLPTIEKHFKRNLQEVGITDAELVTALDARLNATQREAAGLRAEVGK